MGSKAPLVASLPLRIFNERGSLELQDLGPLFFVESFDLQVCGLGLGHSPPFFRLTSNAFLTGSVGRIEKKKQSQEVSQEEAWYPSIIALEPGNKKT